MREEYFKWHSPNLGREIEMLVFGHAGYPVILFPTSMGSFHENRDQGLVGAASWFIEQGLVQIFCPDSIDKDSFYNKHIHPADKIRNHTWYDKMICHEIVERVKNNTYSGKVAVAGCSFGGYHAANFAFRHPGYVSHMFSMSGAFDIKDFMYGFHNSDVYYNSPEDYLPGLNDHELWNMDIVLGTSNWDICFDANLRLSRVLSGKNVHHWLDVRQDRQHDWPVWREMFPHYLSRIRFF
ncbi:MULTISPECIES: esterase family protein [unclassified Flavobacterium]|uniref:esterase family protein n=1 Tax=unclassified Flavobacterium TaxID=196869 RepID=UPI001F14542C|nr:MULTISPECIES: alpha/beta hydrolase-fold protein [unclassified Flavobacterium]UMY64720.1 alpha/beta hydrolase-fold protein [Flavobacterium sp. HJ-32-4]HLN95045.1 alpha/beta hydrolase-fold protein [Flavobacterium sp.]